MKEGNIRSSGNEGKTKPNQHRISRQRQALVVGKLTKKKKIVIYKPNIFEIRASYKGIMVIRDEHARVNWERRLG